MSLNFPLLSFHCGLVLHAWTPTNLLDCRCGFLCITFLVCSNVKLVFSLHIMKCELGCVGGGLRNIFKATNQPVHGNINIWLTHWLAQLKTSWVGKHVFNSIIFRLYSLLDFSTLLNLSPWRAGVWYAHPELEEQIIQMKNWGLLIAALQSFSPDPQNTTFPIYFLSGVKRSFDISW